MKVSAGQEIPYLLWNPKSLYYIHKSLPKDTTLIQLNAAHNLTPYFVQIHCNTVLQLNIYISHVVSSLQIFHLKFCLHFSPPMCAVCPAYFI